MRLARAEKGRKQPMYVRPDLSGGMRESRNRKVQLKGRTFFIDY